MPWTAVCPCGASASVSRLVASTKPKFHPIRSMISAPWKCVGSRPAAAIAPGSAEQGDVDRHDDGGPEPLDQEPSHEASGERGYHVPAHDVARGGLGEAAADHGDGHRHHHDALGDRQRSDHDLHDRTPQNRHDTDGRRSGGRLGHPPRGRAGTAAGRRPPRSGQRWPRRHPRKAPGRARPSCGRRSRAQRTRPREPRSVSMRSPSTLQPWAPPLRRRSGRTGSRPVLPRRRTDPGAGGGSSICEGRRLPTTPHRGDDRGQDEGGLPSLVTRIARSAPPPPARQQ